MNFPIRSSSIVNQTTHMFNIEIPPEWNVGESNEIVSQEQVDNGVEVYNTNNLWPSSNKDGYPSKWSFETALGNSIDDDNYLTSPADGLVLQVLETNGPKELELENKKFTKISMFLLFMM